MLYCYLVHCHDIRRKATSSALMRIEIINTGSELMLGRVLNTHQQWLCRQLADLSYPVQRQVAVDDSSVSIHQAVSEALARADLILVTGGLGPTSDDRTRPLIAELLGRKLVEDNAVVAHIEQLFAKLQRPMPASTRVQALVPEGATVLMNAHGTAPGLVLESQGQASHGAPCLLFMLPGPPRELRPMFTEQVAPLLRERFPVAAPFVCRTLKTTGLGESLVEERIAGPLEPLVHAGLEVAYCARVGEVEVRVSATGQYARERVAEAEQLVRRTLGDLVYGSEDDLLEAVVIRLLTGKKRTVAVAESCTGGLIANRLTNVPGASEVFLAGLVTYSNQAKENLLGVFPETLATYGAVSEPAAREMAEGARRRTGADYGIAVTGIAGPGGGTEEKPVGTVYVALASEAGTVARLRHNPYDRDTFKHVTSQQALDMLRRKLQNINHH
jgi:nicotinamide-nucleotide amidase